MSNRHQTQRLALGGAVLALSAVVSVACGLSATATGDFGDGGPSTSPTGPGPGNGGGDAGVTDDASQGNTCAGTVCGGACSDLAVDPQNCGACGTVCGNGQTCEGGMCRVQCAVDELRCAEVCVDPKSDPAHCGTCGNLCPAKFLCASGVCQMDCGTTTLCPDPPVTGGVQYCADLTKDRNNCGMCGKKCSANETCTGSTCRPLCGTGATVGDTFNTPITMVGCLGRVGFDQRALLCPVGAHVCTAQEWVARRAGKVPTYNYWTNDDLAWSGDNGNCAARSNGGYSCRERFSDPRQPMRVCGRTQDALGNRCNWTGCGLDANAPNEYFGGCQGNPTAATLCCN